MSNSKLILINVLVLIWRTWMMRMFQVEKSRPLLLPYLVFVKLLLVVTKFVEGRGMLCWERFLKPHLSQKHVECEGSNHETRIKGESGSQGLHDGPGVSLSFNLAGAEYDTERAINGFATKAPTTSCKLSVPRRVGDCDYRVPTVKRQPSFEVWFTHQQDRRHHSSGYYPTAISS